MADFEKYAPKLRRLEGGFVDDPSDSGGATMCGVTLGTYRYIFGESKSVDDLRNITDREWTYIMKSRFWDKCKGDKIVNQSVAEIFVDWCINAGGNAINSMQKVFGIKIDGLVGPTMLGKFNDPDSRKVFERIRYAREAYYRKIADANPKNRKFLRGWLNRTNSFQYEAD